MKIQLCLPKSQTLQQKRLQVLSRHNLNTIVMIIKII